MAWLRRVLSARPSSSSLCPQPYMSEESMKLIPRSSARCTTSIDCASSLFPYVPDIDMHPSPMAETWSSLFPSLRYCMAVSREMDSTSVLHGFQEGHDLLDGAEAQRVAPRRHAFGGPAFDDRLVGDLDHPFAVSRLQASKIAARLGAQGVGGVAVGAVLVEEVAARRHVFRDSDDRGPRPAPRRGLGADRAPRGKAVFLG